MGFQPKNSNKLEKCSREVMKPSWSCHFLNSFWFYKLFQDWLSRIPFRFCLSPFTSAKLLFTWFFPHNSCLSWKPIYSPTSLFRPRTFTNWPFAKRHLASESSWRQDRNSFTVWNLQSSYEQKYRYKNLPGYRPILPQKKGSNCWIPRHYCLNLAAIF